MNKSGRNIVVTALLTIMAFCAVVYSACKKKSDTTPDACAVVVCQNNGSCFKGVCTCAKGFDGAHCENRWLPKYLGTWKIDETISGSNKLLNIGDQRHYSSVFKKKEGSNFMFLIDDFMNDSTYDNISCEVGYDYSADHFRFGSNQPLGNSQTTLIDGQGVINSIGDNINGTYYVTYPDNTTIITDTVSFTAALQ